MSGVAVIRYLLANASPVIALVPATRIMAGEFPINTVLPAISITEISSVPRLTLAMTEPNRMHTERVQVSVLVKGPQGTPAGLGVPGIKALLPLILTACAHRRGTVAGFYVDSILPDQEGPDLFDEPDAIYQGSRDFIVRWKSPS